MSYPDALALGGAGYLYVASAGYTIDTISSVAIYPPQGTVPMRSIIPVANTGFSPTALALNGPSLFVGITARYRDSNVNLFPPGSATALRTVATGNPTALVFDKSHNLYVAATLHNGQGKYVEVYTPDLLKLVRSIPDGDATALAFDKTGNLYVASFSSVLVYAPESTTLLRTITHGVSKPSALAFDSEGNLYVANRGNDSVTVYAPGTIEVLRKIRQGIHAPTALAIGTQ
jgi:sugar lactone lactonase YvrE